jgi:predicted nucleotidyltransferase
VTDDLPARLSDLDRRQIAAAVALLEEVLGDVVLGMALYGSAVAGGLKPRSDLDLFGVLARRTAPDERATIVRRLLTLSRRGHPEPGARSLEVTLVVRDDVVPWRYPARQELQYGDWWRREYQAGDLEPWANPSPDLATLIAQVRLEGRALVGPRPAQLLPEVPVADLRRAMLDSVPPLLADLPTDTRNVLLTLARIWSTLETGRFLAKDAAADWAAERLGPADRVLLQRARDGYRGAVDETWSRDDVRVEQLAQTLVARIEATSAG